MYEFICVSNSVCKLNTYYNVERTKARKLFEVSNIEIHQIYDGVDESKKKVI